MTSLLRPVVALNEQQLAEVLRRAFDLAREVESNKREWVSGAPGTIAVPASTRVLVLPVNTLRRAVVFGIPTGQLAGLFNGDWSVPGNVGIVLNGTTGFTIITYDQIGGAICQAWTAVGGTGPANVQWQEWVAPTPGR